MLLVTEQSLASILFPFSSLHVLLHFQSTECWQKSVSCLAKYKSAEFLPTLAAQILPMDNLLYTLFVIWTSVSSGHFCLIAIAMSLCRTSTGTDETVVTIKGVLSSEECKSKSIMSCCFLLSVRGI